MYYNYYGLISVYNVYYDFSQTFILLLDFSGNHKSIYKRQYKSKFENYVIMM